ncbi:FAD/NAD-P-binding domain-containing protein [Cytidiella melzeri]|nr:FAD/NAD-P-binding domain-containing protein [Cytidiella melzeri]
MLPSSAMSADESGKKLDIVIVGGGVCGLVCAIALAKRGIHAHVYEAAAKFGEIGAGIGVGYNAIGILREIGLWEDILTQSGEDARSACRFFNFVSGMEGHELVYDYPADPKGGNFGIARSVFLDALVGHMDPQYTHFNKRCTSVTQPTTNDSRSTVHFSDGTSVQADVVLLANGIRGAGREAVTGTDSKNNITFSNVVCYRGLITTKAAKANGVKTDIYTRPACFMGQDKHLIIFPIKGGTVVNIVAFVIDRTVEIGDVTLPSGQPLVVPVTKEEMLKEYEGWGSDVIGILSCVEDPNKWYINVVYPPLQSYVKGKVALLGDAAHGMVPHLGAGAGQGIEDAYLLSQLLSHPQTTIDNLESVLEVYDTVRRPRAQSVWEGSVRAAEIYEGHGKHGSTNEGRRQDLEGIWSFVWHHEPDEDFQAQQ